MASRLEHSRVADWPLMHISSVSTPRKHDRCDFPLKSSQSRILVFELLVGVCGQRSEGGRATKVRGRGGGCRSDHEVTGELAGTLAVPSAPFKHTYLAGNIRAAVSQSGNSAEDGGAEGGESE
jgi:hypothetical protein